MAEEIAVERGGRVGDWVPVIVSRGEITCKLHNDLRVIILPASVRVLAVISACLEAANGPMRSRVTLDIGQ